MKLQDTYDMGIYCRLSRDDNNGNLESMSIGNQRQILSDYVKEKGWNLKETYTDDGYSGTTFDRPDFKRMINDVERGKIDCIITKDLSRLGRNYVQIGYYTEEYFLEKKIRYIAINDSIDTMQGNNDIAPFQNIINEWYPKDISKKVRQVKKNSARQGKFMGSKAPYGYIKSPADKHLLIVDEEAARIVRRVFKEFVSGNNSARHIAITLNDQNIDGPRAYHYKLIGLTNPNLSESPTWCSNTVMQMIQNKVYIGHMVQCKRQVVSFKTKRREFTNPSDWISVENTHEPIIGIEEWDATQKKIFEKKRIRTNSKSEVSLFAGILKCADCGGALSYTVKHLAHGPKNLYKCSRFTNHGKKGCTAHYTYESMLIDSVMNDIRGNAFLAKKDREALIKNLTKQTESEQKNDTSFYRSKLKEIEKRIDVIDAQIKNLYEDKCAGKLPENIFQKLLTNYNKEQIDLINKQPEYQNAIDTAENAKSDISSWISLIETLIDIEHLTRSTVVELIDSITISEPEIVNGVKHQEVQIKYNFVGYLKSAKRKEDVA